MAGVTVAKPAADEAVVRRVELATRMIGLGARVFPLQPGGKKPLIAGSQGGRGFLDASDDVAMAQVFLSNPGKPNYGVAFPPESDVIVLDLDGGGDGGNPDWKADWQRLYEQLGPPGLTYIVRSASGGRHVYYRWRTDLYGPIPPGDEMLGWTVRKPWKGYLVGPGSIVDGQVYEPVGIDTISDLPEAWARAALDEAAARRTPAGSGDRLTIRVGGGPADVAKGHRHAFLRDKARHLVGVGLTGETLFAAVMDINRQLAEPKTEDEVRRAIGDAEAKFEADPVDETGRKKVFAHRDVGIVQTPPDLTYYTAAEVSSLPGADVEWALYGYLAFGGITELVGGPKIGKTTLVFGLINALVSGDQYLGLRTSSGPVVVLTEQGPTSLKAVLKRTGIDQRDDVHFLLHRDIRGEEWPGVVSSAFAQCGRVNAQVLIVDTLPAFAGLAGDAENDAGAALEAMAPLLEVASHGLAILVNRHRGKGPQRDIADEGRGSSAFSGAVDVILTLRRKTGMARPSIRELAAASRFDETPEELVIELGEDGYVALGTEQAIAAQEAEFAIIEALTNEPDLTMRGLVEATGKVRRTIERAIGDLVEARHVKRTGEGKPKAPYRYRLAASKEVFAQNPSRRDDTSDVQSTDIDGIESAAPPDADASSRPDPVPNATWLQPCRDYRAHQAHHRKTAQGWICDICSSEGAA
jgi:hypothetical protein